METSKTRGIASTEDDLNRSIIKMLQDDGRLPYKDIARALKVSEGTIRNRVQSMKQSGALKIVALADAYDAMTSTRVYRPRRPDGDPLQGRRDDRNQGRKPGNAAQRCASSQRARRGRLRALGFGAL